MFWFQESIRLIKNNSSLVFITIVILILAMFIPGLLTGAAVNGPKPLVLDGEWAIDGDLVAFSRDDIEVYVDIREDMKGHQDFAVWRSWLPEKGVVPARIKSKPFMTGKYIALPYSGFPKADGNSVSLFCESTAQASTLNLSRTNNVFSVAYLKIDKRWCSGDIAILVDAKSQYYFVAVATPFEITALEYYLNNGLAGGFFWFLAIFSVVVFSIYSMVIFFSFLFRGILPLHGAILCSLGVMGSLYFYLAWYDLQMHKMVSSYVFWTIPLVVIGCLYLDKRQFYKINRQLAVPLFLWFISSLYSFISLYLIDTGAGTWLANSRYDPVGWSSDNQLQQLLAEKLFAGFNISEVRFGSWYPTDRGGLLSGLYLLTREFFSQELQMPSSSMAIYYNSLGVIFNSVWVIPAFSFISSRLAGRDKIIALMFLLLSPLVLFNSIYAWPKLLSAAFLLSALFCFYNENRVTGSRLENLCLGFIVALLCAFGLVSHGGAVFGIIPLVLVFLLIYRRSIGLVLTGSLLATALVIGGWYAWVAYVLPSGSLLVKYMFTGITDFSARDVGLFDYVYAHFTSISFLEYINAKLMSLKLFLGFSIPWGLNEMHLNGGSDVLGELRIAEFLSPMRALGIVNLATVYVGFIYWRSPKRLDEIRSLLLIVVMGYTGIFLNFVLMWKENFTHTQSYMSILLVLIGVVVALIKISDMPARLLLIAIFLNWALVWIVGPLLAHSGIESVVRAGVLLILVYTALWRSLVYTSGMKFGSERDK